MERFPRLLLNGPVLMLEETTSTNDEVKQLLRSGTHGRSVCVCARLQTRGRGQRDARWESAPGAGLTFSAGFFPGALKAEEQFLLSMAASLAVKELLDKHLETGGVTVKWPNDVLVNGKKICGILIENTLAGQTVGSSVIGIGLNVNGPVPAALPHAVTMEALAGRPFDTDILLEELLDRLDALLVRLLKQQAGKALKERYHACLHGMGRVQWFMAAGKEFEGVIKGTGDRGELLITTTQGEDLRFFAREVTQQYE